MIYNFNLGIGWASSGVEYAQAYRAKVFRNIGLDAKFIFTDMLSKDNIQHMTENMGFLDSEIIWLYTFFTDCKTAPSTYTLEQLKRTIRNRGFTFSRKENIVRYDFPGHGNYYKVYMATNRSDCVQKVEMVSNGCLIRRDYYTYCKIYSEYFAPLNNQAHLYQRRFFNVDGTVAYEEILDGDTAIYRFPDRLITSKEELVGYMVSCLNLTERDTIIIDRTTGIGQAIIQNAFPAKIGSVIHADHFNESGTDESHVLWNNYYEYIFSQHKHIDFYVTATSAQNCVLAEQFKQYMDAEPKIMTIPVGSLDELKIPELPRRKHALITASRLAKEKHIDWLVEAVVEARKKIPDLSLDIYGKGGEESKLRDQINKFHCSDYIRLCGQQKLDGIYQDYEAYLSGSTSEGFGLTLMEAIGSGLPIIGFDVRYGNQTFIDDGENGFSISIQDNMEKKERIQKIAECIVRLFTETDIEKFHQHSYKKAKLYLVGEVEKKWIEILN